MLIEALQKQSGLSLSQLQYFALTASRRYKVYQIPKRTGGSRTIEHPSRQLKAIQRWLNKALFQTFDVHPSATAYQKGASIRDNAIRHAGSTFTLRMDFANFFPSFSSDDVSGFLTERNETPSLELSDTDITFASAIATRDRHLTIGAPSSPILTNAMMFDFDRRISARTGQLGLVYTRYADDLFISSREPNRLNEIAEEITAAAVAYERVSLRINRKKTAYLSRRYRRSITGLIVTPDQKISIGRDRKREIKALVHLYKNGALDADRSQRLRGLLAFTMDVESDFFQALIAKYGVAILNEILGKDQAGTSAHGVA